MGELEKAVEARRRPPERNYLDNWRDESQQRTVEFVDMMRERNIGSTALYHEFNTHVKVPARWPSTRESFRTDRTLTYVDSGWVATKTTSDGPWSHYIILPDTRVFGCNLPGLYPEEQDNPAITHDPYVTISGSLDRPEQYLFALDHGLKLLTEAVEHEGKPRL